MDFLRHIINQIRNNLAGLTFSEKWVIGLLMVIMCFGMVWLVDYNSTRKLVPLIDSLLKTDERSTITGYLEAWGDKYEMRGQRVFVLNKNRSTILHKLYREEAMPTNIEDPFDITLRDNDLWVSDAQRQKKNSVILQRALAQNIRQWSDVKTASVIVTPGGHRTLGNIRPFAKATVNITTGGSRADMNKLASAAVAYVSGGVDNCNREDISVIINGSDVANKSALYNEQGEYLRQQNLTEQKYINVIRDLLPKGLKPNVQVSVKLVNSNVRSHITKILPDKNGSILYSDTSDMELTEETNEKNQEVGLVANTSQARGGSGISQTRGEETSDTVGKLVPGTDETWTETKGGGTENISAAIFVSDGYFRAMAIGKGNDNPSEMDILNIAEPELKKYQELILSALGLSDNESSNVKVELYWAGGETSEVVFDENAADEGIQVTKMISHFGKEIAISVLAMISLTMVLMMVKKSVGPVELTEEEAVTMMAGEKPLDAFGLEDSNFMDDDNDGLLAGMEMDDEAIRSQKMLQQVRDLVNESPEDASDLISKWINEES